MILVDTSAWIEFLRGTGHPVHVALKRLLQDGAPIATTEPVVMELLAGTSGGSDTARMRDRLSTFPRLRVRGLPDFERAAELYRTCRARGGTVRRLVDCLIAAVALREGAAVLHNDGDYDVLAKHVRLRIQPLPKLPSRR